MKKPIAAGLMALGAVSSLVGLVAVIVPVLPSTPFFLLGIVFFMHGSPRFVAWFRRLPYCRCYIDDFLRERSMTRCNKIKTLAFGTVVIAISFILTTQLWLRVSLVVLTAVKYYYFAFCVWTNVEEGHGVCQDDRRGEGDE